MPLTPAITDKFTKVGTPGTATTLSAPGYTIGNVSITVGSTTNWPPDTKVYFAMDNAQIVNGVEQRIAGSYCEFSGIVTGAGTIGSLTLEYGTAQNYVAGSLTRVYIPVSSSRENAMVDGLNQDHNGKGNHKSLTDDNNNEWLERGQTANAVNQVKATNAATGHNPVLSSSGDDANSGVSIASKGTGVSDIDGAAPKPFIQNAMFNFVESGCVWSGDSYGSTLNASMTAGVVWIAGKRLTVAAVTAHAFTANKDTYVDLQDNNDGTAKFVYTEATTNAVSPVVPNSLTEASNVRVAIIVSGANIASVGSVNQGQETKLLPIASSRPYVETDSLGNLICPRDPTRKILGMAQTATALSTALTAVQASPVLICPVIVPPGRKVKISAFAKDGFNSSASGFAELTIWDGVAGSGTQLQNATVGGTAANGQAPLTPFITTTPASANKTYAIGYRAVVAGTGTIDAGPTFPIQLLVELA